jgi:hypothetical protein
MSRVGADTALWTTDLFMVVFGFGLGMNMQSVVLAMQNSVEPRDMGVATSAVTFFRQVGGSLGTAIFLSILFSQAGTNIAHNLSSAGIPPSATGGLDLNDTSKLATLPAQVKHPILVGFSDAMDVVFLVGACVLVVAVVLSIMLKEVPLRTMSGMQAARAAAAGGDAASGDADTARPARETIDPSPTAKRN